MAGYSTDPAGDPCASAVASGVAAVDAVGHDHDALGRVPEGVDDGALHELAGHGDGPRPGSTDDGTADASHASFTRPKNSG